MYVVRQADDPFVCFGAKPDKGFGLEISTGTPVKELEEGTQREGSWQSIPDSRRDQSA